MKTVRNKIQNPIYVGIVFLLCSIVVELLFILWLNDGLLIYTLDDPYIHMALAENIKHGHYGINMSEFSAPSSSILWPFIIAPFSSYEYSPFLINVVCALASVIVVVKTLNVSFDISDKFRKDLFISVAVVFFILATNVVGLVFTGMEHSLQVLLVLLIAYGLIIEIEKNEIKWWFLASIIIAPLVRYECMAISIAALSYIAMRGQFKYVSFAIVLLSIFLGGFTVFLMSMGLHPFPASVVAKSPIVQSGGALHSIIANLSESLFNRQGTILSFGTLALLSYLFFGKNIKKKPLAVVTVFALFMHFIAGKYGWYHRYEIYILSFMLIIIMYVFASVIKNYLVDTKKTSTNIAGCIVIAMGFTIIGVPYICALPTIPIAANNIFEQQYQMHRFAVNYYNKPIAVNDLGYSSYKNNNYVLDLWGLGSERVLKFRLDRNNVNWMKGITDKKNIGLVMIYEDGFKNIPDEWIKIGYLHLGKRKITPYGSEVAFYATRLDVYSDIVSKLSLFVKTLPVDVKFTFEERSTN